MPEGSAATALPLAAALLVRKPFQLSSDELAQIEAVVGRESLVHGA